MLGRLKPFLNAYLKWGAIATAYGGAGGASLGLFGFVVTGGDGACSKGGEECIDALLGTTAAGGVIGGKYWWSSFYFTSLWDI